MPDKTFRIHLISSQRFDDLLHLPCGFHVHQFNNQTEYLHQINNFTRADVVIIDTKSIAEKLTFTLIRHTLKNVKFIMIVDELPAHEQNNYILRSEVSAAKVFERINSNITLPIN